MSMLPRTTNRDIPGVQGLVVVSLSSVEAASSSTMQPEAENIVSFTEIPENFGTNKVFVGHMANAGYRC